MLREKQAPFMDCPHYLPLFRPSIVVFTVLKNAVALLVGLLQPIDLPTNAQRFNTEKISMDIVLKARRWNHSFRGNQHLETTND